MNSEVVIVNTPHIPADEKKRLAALRQSTLDELTGTGNRLGFIFLAQHMLNLCARQGAPATLVYFELHGCDRGNDVSPLNMLKLKRFAELMRSTFRVTDLTARMSGNQFVVLFTNTPLAHTQIALEKFQEAVTQNAPELHYSTGIAGFFPNRSTDVEDLITEASAQIAPFHHIKSA
ncbi:GGDEF domain-containing protein [Corallincola platygyrae]|uniref:diguanylate cyclase n=1 Tax=Corallincola platygyrae TaxID=1193278 RepID=A0ABW4XRJ0_9GAMM